MPAARFESLVREQRSSISGIGIGAAVGQVADVVCTTKKGTLGCGEQNQIKTENQPWKSLKNAQPTSTQQLHQAKMQMKVSAKPSTTRTMLDEVLLEYPESPWDDVLENGLPARGFWPGSRCATRRSTTECCTARRDRYLQSGQG